MMICSRHDESPLVDGYIAFVHHCSAFQHVFYDFIVFNSLFLTTHVTVSVRRT